MKMLHASLLASLLAVSPLLPAQPTLSSGTVTTAPGKARAVRTVRTTATVVGIVPETRTISLKRADGKIVEIQAGDEVKNGLSNRLRRQANLKSGVQVVLVLTMALRMVSSLRMQATNATLGSLPELVSRS